MEEKASWDGGADGRPGARRPPATYPAQPPSASSGRPAARPAIHAIGLIGGDDRGPAAGRASVVGGTGLIRKADSPATGLVYDRLVRAPRWLWPSWRGVVLDVLVAAVVTWLNLYEAVYAPPGPLVRTTGAMVAVTV